MTPLLKANLLFLLVTAIWGATFPLIKFAVNTMDPNVFVFLRFSLAALCMLPFLFFIKAFKQASWGVLKAGLILGVLNSAVYGFQTASMQYISASRCAFITGFSVVLIPFFSYFFKLARLRIIDVLAALICLFGLYILTGANLAGLNIGDLLVFLCALAWALEITYLQKLSMAHYPVILLAFLQIVFLIPIALLLGANKLQASICTWPVFAVIVFCALFATIFPMIVQTKYQRDTTAVQASLIFSLEPVFASLYAYLFLHEIVTRATWIGGGLIVLGIILPVVADAWKARRLR